MLWWTQLHYLEPNPILYLGNKIKYSTSRLLFTKLNIPLKSTYHRYCGISLIWQYPQVLTLGLTDLFLGFSAHKAFHTISKLDEGGKDLLSNLFLKQGHPDGSPGSQRMEIPQPLWTTYSSAGWPSEGKSVSCCEQKLQMHLELGRFPSQARVVCPKRGLRTSFPKEFSQLGSALSQKDSMNSWERPEGTKKLLINTRKFPVFTDFSGRWQKRHQTSCDSPWLHTQHMMFLTELK